MSNELLKKWFSKIIIRINPNKSVYNNMKTNKIILKQNRMSLIVLDKIALFNIKAKKHKIIFSLVRVNWCKTILNLWEEVVEIKLNNLKDSSILIRINGITIAKWILFRSPKCNLNLQLKRKLNWLNINNLQTIFVIICKVH